MEIGETRERAGVRRETGEGWSEKGERAGVRGE